MEKQYIFIPLQERPKDLGNQKVLDGFNSLTWKTIYIQPAAGEKKLENKKVLKVFNSLTRKTQYIFSPLQARKNFKNQKVLNVFNIFAEKRSNWPAAGEKKFHCAMKI